MEQVVLSCHNFFCCSLLFIAVLGILNCLRISWKNNLRINSKIKLRVYYSCYCRLLSTKFIAFHLTRCNDWMRTTHRMLAGIAHKPSEVFLPSKWEWLCSYSGSMGVLQLSNHVVQNRHTGEQMTLWGMFKKATKFEFRLFNMSPCSPVSWFCTTWLLSCKRLILWLLKLTTWVELKFSQKSRNFCGSPLTWSSGQVS